MDYPEFWAKVFGNEYVYPTKDTTIPKEKILSVHELIEEIECNLRNPKTDLTWSDLREMLLDL